MPHRLERDPLGPVQVPDDAYYGAQTARALDNFPISGMRAHAALVRATIVIKLACAEANGALKRLQRDTAGAIARAAAFLTWIVAVTRSAGARRPLMGKFSTARAVWIP